MLKAILSDVHSNLEAFTAVLADAASLGVQSVYNLGDTLGDGPNPLECLDLAMQLPVVLLGPSDLCSLYIPEGYSKIPSESMVWTQTQFETVGEPGERQRRVAYIENRPRTHRDNHRSLNVLYVHGSPRNPLSEYVFPEDVLNLRKMGRISALFDDLCFCGHTHTPGIFQEISPGTWDYFHEEECVGGFPVAGCKLICSVGTVGQPLDDDERACYALFDGERIWFRRVMYDVETTLHKLYAVGEIHELLADRLRKNW